MEVREKSKTGKHTIHIIGFLLLLIFIMQVLGYYFMPSSNLTMYRFSGGGIYGEAEDTLDIVVLGSSNTSCAVSPIEWYEQYGTTAYSCGKVWGTTTDMYFMLKKIYRRQCPQVVVLCVDTLYAKFAQSSDLEYTSMRTMDNLFSLVYYHDDWKTLFDDGLWRHHHYKDTDALKGYSLSTECEHRAAPENFMLPEQGITPIPTLQKLYLDAIVRLCEKNGSELVLTCIPDPGWTTEKANAVQQYATQHDLLFYDCNANLSSIGLNWDTDTFASGHMNLYGAIKVTNALGEYLNAHYELPNHKGQDAYAAWEQSVEQYNAAKQAALQ